MESFDLAPSGVTSETIQNEIQKETIVITEKVPGLMTAIVNNNDMISKNNSIDLVKDADKISKNINVIMSNGETCVVNKKASNEITVINVDDSTNKEKNILIVGLHWSSLRSAGILLQRPDTIGRVELLESIIESNTATKQ